MNFDEAFQRLLGHEGGYVNNPADPGGATRWGITERVARRNGYKGDMRELPVELAKVIARAEYWDAVKCEAIPPGARFDLFDTAYNSGPDRAIKLLQSAVGAEPDGVIGPKTMKAISDMEPGRLVARFNGWRLDFMNDLQHWPTFGRGWAQRIAENLKAA